MGNIRVVGGDIDGGVGGGGADRRSVVDGDVDGGVGGDGTDRRRVVDVDGGAGGHRSPARLATDLPAAVVPGANGCHVPPDTDPHLRGDEEDDKGGVLSRILFRAAGRPAAETRKPGRPKKVNGCDLIATTRGGRRGHRGPGRTTTTLMTLTRPRLLIAGTSHRVTVLSWTRSTG